MKLVFEKLVRDKRDWLVILKLFDGLLRKDDLTKIEQFVAQNNNRLTEKQN